MAEVDISPLAKRLAEENNVNWRALSGSGEDGRIVERDVLDYLARVMAGEEAPDPTPEPLPDGMQAWPDGAPPTGGTAAEASRDERSSAPSGGDDDLLEVESADAGSPGGSSDDWSQGEWGADDWGAAPANESGEDDDVFSGLNDLGGDAGREDDEGGFDFGGADDHRSFEFGRENEGQAYGLAGDSGEGGDFDFGTESSDDDRSVFDTSSMEPPIDEGIFVFDDEEPVQSGAAPESAPNPAAAEPEPAAGARGSEPAQETRSAEVADDFDFVAEGTEDEAGEEGEAGYDERTVGAAAGSDTEHTPWEGMGATAAEVEDDVATAERAGESHWTPAEPGAMELASSDAPWTAVAQEEFETAPRMPAEASEYDFLDTADGALPEGVRIEEDEYRVVRSGAAAGPAVTTAVEATGAAPTDPDRSRSARGLTGGGIVLRREVDVTALIEASQALASELDGEPSLAAFLLRAAARAGNPWPLAAMGQEVGVARLSDDGIAITVVPQAGTMPFRDLIVASSGGPDGSGEPALAVADVSQLGIDEAVLDVGSPVLTIGRVLDSVGGRLHATLTLSGVDAPESGSKFLGRVAELLAAPVRIVL
ncbi:MAG TPA: E3 binding domain-containing protein [Trueperaceae bacterium]